MCGITGFIDFNKRSNSAVLERMVLSMRHRGPDDYGAKSIESSLANVGLGQVRLSIIDLTNGGHQPMHYNNLSIVFNGEIYNYQEIRRELEKLGHRFISHSDTEVILHAVDQWGDDAVHKFIGMFAYCIYDSKTQEITITRDRAGIKPLYYYFKSGCFLFGSELKALMAHPSFEKTIDSKVLPLYLQYGYIPASYSIFRDCYKLKPGHHLKFDLLRQEVKVLPYWNVTDYYTKPRLTLDYEEAKEELHRLLKSALGYRMVSDVAVGVFLSGGYDSTAVTAILQADQAEKLKTFTIGFEEGNNESPYARQIAGYLGTDHTEYTCTTKEVKNIIPYLPFYYDEPFGDSSAIPTTLVSQLARKEVKVALSADAGDEVFCGYNSYFKLNDYLSKLNKIPSSLKPLFSVVGSSITTMFPIGNEENKHKMRSFFKILDKDKLKQGKQLFQLMNEKPAYYINNFFSFEKDSYNSPFDIDTEGFDNCLDVAMAVDYQAYLQNDILTKVDRATMSVSLEGREPLLDHRLTEFSAQLPVSYKYDGKSGKKILKDIVHDYIPKEMMDRPKAGFSLPIYKWLRGDLSFLLDEYLNEQSLQWSGLLNEKFICQEVKKFKNNKLYYTPIIWYLLMFQMWYKRWVL